MTRPNPALAGSDGPGGQNQDTPSLQLIGDGPAIASYEARPVRTRATRAEMAERSEMLIDLAYSNGPCSVRHLYYAATVAKMGSTDAAGGLIRVRTPPAPYVPLLSTHGSEEGTACASARYSRRSVGSVARS